MTSPRSFRPLVAALILAPVPAFAAAASADQLVVTQLPDPDPNFVPPPPEKKVPQPKRSSDENPTLDQAFENLGKVTGALAQRMGSQYRPSEADLKAAQERLRQRLQESNDRLNAAKQQAAAPSGY